MTNSPRPQQSGYRVLSPARLGAAPLVGLAALMLAMLPLVRWVEDLAPTQTGPLDLAGFAPVDDSGLKLVVHIQDAGFFIEGADAELSLGDRRIWCDAERCDEQDMRTLTERLATIKLAHPDSDHVVFVAGMTVPFGRVQAAMDAARADDWDVGPGQEPDWLFPRVTVQPDQLGEDRYLSRRVDAHARI
jgi:hypothetical protein